MSLQQRDDRIAELEKQVEDYQKALQEAREKIASLDGQLRVHKKVLMMPDRH